MIKNICLGFVVLFVSCSSKESGFYFNYEKTEYITIIDKQANDTIRVEEKTVINQLFKEYLNNNNVEPIKFLPNYTIVLFDTTLIFIGGTSMKHNGRTYNLHASPEKFIQTLFTIDKQ